MLDKCGGIAEVSSLEFNAEKCHCIAFTEMCNSEIKSMGFDRNIVDWCETMRYLVVLADRLILALTLLNEPFMLRQCV